jgi:23S rRNA G2445 N2-methylase RlmL
MMTKLSHYYAHTMPGCEEIAWLEIRKRFSTAKFVEYLFVKDQNGIVRWSDSVGTSELLTLRTTEDLFVQATPTAKLSRDWRDLRQIEQLFRESEMLRDAVNLCSGQRKPLTYRVISRKSGNHQYRRKDFEEACIKGLESRRQRNWKLVDDNADVEIWANIIGSTLLCGVRLSDRTMRHRPYQVVSRPASLRPSVAAAMVWLTEPSPHDHFVDPMCGGGTILAERMLAAPYQMVRGGDISVESVRAATENLRTIQQPFQVEQWNACALPLASDSIHKAATNLPFGKQIGSPDEIRRLYPCFFQELARVLQPGGVATILSSEYELVKNTIRQLPALRIVTGYSIAVLGQWGRLYIIQKA